VRFEKVFRDAGIGGEGTDRCGPFEDGGGYGDTGVGVFEIDVDGALELIGGDDHEFAVRGSWPVIRGVERGANEPRFGALNHCTGASDRDDSILAIADFAARRQNMGLAATLARRSIK